MQTEGNQLRCRPNTGWQGIPGTCSSHREPQSLKSGSAGGWYDECWHTCGSESTLSDRWSVPERYDGARPCRHWNVRTHNRYWILSRTLSEWSSRRGGVVCSDHHRCRHYHHPLNVACCLHGRAPQHLVNLLDSLTVLSLQCPMWGRGTPFPLVHSLPRLLLFFYFSLFSLALTIFFFCPSLSVLPE